MKVLIPIIIFFINFLLIFYCKNFLINYDNDISILLSFILIVMYVICINKIFKILLKHYNIQYIMMYISVVISVVSFILFDYFKVFWKLK